MIRTFIAFDIIPSEALTEVIQTIMHKLRNERITWVQPGTLHVTLKFLGDTGEQQIPLIKQSLAKSVLSCNPFRIMLEGIGVFKNIHDPRVLWMGCRTEKSLADLRDKIDLALNMLGYEKEARAFSPHITLGRIKLMRQTNHLSEIIAAFKEKVFQESQINEIIFYESRLSANGAVYTPIEKFKFPPSQS
jgi:2'-5' RNA ligase